MEEKHVNILYWKLAISYFVNVGLYRNSKGYYTRFNKNLGNKCNLHVESLPAGCSYVEKFAILIFSQGRLYNRKYINELK